jgi:hypothetical protein
VVPGTDTARSFHAVAASELYGVDVNFFGKDGGYRFSEEINWLDM